MIPPIPPLSAGSSQSAGAAAVGPSAAAGGSAVAGAPAGAGSASGFDTLLGNAIDQANGVQQNATNLALLGATGQANVADVTVAATEAQLSVQMITAVRDRAVTAFNSIMSMAV